MAVAVTTIEARQVTGPWAGHGEGPVWDRASGRLGWVDLFRGDLLFWRPADAAPVRLHIGRVAAAWRPRRDGGMVLGVERGFALIGPPPGTEPDQQEPDQQLPVERLPPLWDDATLRMNDGACDPAGRFYCGSMDWDAAPRAGALYRLDPDRGAQSVLDGLTISNGLAFSPDGEYAYLIDTPEQQITRYRVDQTSGRFVDPEAVLRIPSADGAPDGMTIDADGGFWVALWDGHAVRHYGPDGDLRTVVTVPVSRPTACTFGGPDLGDLYITTSAEGISRAAEPEAGSVFVARPGVSGRSVSEVFAG